MRQTIAVFVFCILVSVCGLGQGTPPSDLQRFITANQRLGAVVLARAHQAAPDENVAIAPLPMTFVFAAIDSEAYSPEIREVLGWRDANLSEVAQMLRARFEPPRHERASSTTARPAREVRQTPLFLGYAGDPGSDVSLENTLWYRGRNPFTAGFIRSAKNEFGIEFHAVNMKTADAKISPPPGWGSGASMPHFTGHRDFSLTSAMHLRSTWKGNVFGLKDRKEGPFMLRDGTRKTVEFMPSELRLYGHFKSDQLEAVVLPANTVQLVLIMPSEKGDLPGLERQIAAEQPAIPAEFHEEIGVVDLPPIHVKFEEDLKDALIAAGIQEPFRDLGGIVNIHPTYLSSILQRTEIEVNERGIRANAGTVMSGIVGGIGSATKFFHMTINRPFLFFIHDNATNALLFAGAVVDPTKP